MGAALLQLPGVQAVKREDTPAGHALYRISASPNQDLSLAIYRLAQARDWPVRELRNDTRALESVFNELVLSSAPAQEYAAEAIAVQPADQPPIH